jgi:hypothetical protein
MAVDKFSNAAGPQHGLIKVVPTSISVGSGSGSVDTNGNITVSSSSSLTVAGCFTSNFNSYLITSNITSTSGSGFWYMRTKSAGSDIGSWTTNGFSMSMSAGTQSNANLGTNNQGIGYAPVAASGNPAQGGFLIDVLNPALANYTAISFRGAVYHNDSGLNTYIGNALNWSATSCDGFSLTYSGTNFTGSFRIYGYNN